MTAAERAEHLAALAVMCAGPDDEEQLRADDRERYGRDDTERAELLD